MVQKTIILKYLPVYFFHVSSELGMISCIGKDADLIDMMSTLITRALGKPAEFTRDNEHKIIGLSFCYSNSQTAKPFIDIHSISSSGCMVVENYNSLHHCYLNKTYVHKVLLTLCFYWFAGDGMVKVSNFWCKNVKDYACPFIWEDTSQIIHFLVRRACKNMYLQLTLNLTSSQTHTPFLHGNNCMVETSEYHIHRWSMAQTTPAPKGAQAQTIVDASKLPEMFCKVSYMWSE